MQWLKLHAWKVGNCGFEPQSGLRVSKCLTTQYIDFKSRYIEFKTQYIEFITRYIDFKSRSIEFAAQYNY